MRWAFLGIDIGGTNTKVAFMRRPDRVLHQFAVASETFVGPRRFVSRLGQIIREKCADLGLRVEGVGIGVPGHVEFRRGILRDSPNMPGWKNVPLKNLFFRQFRRKILLDNDANIAAWGAFVLELKRRPQQMVLITLGTGVGGGLIFGGKIYHGINGSAGEIGHMRLVPGGARCSCGGRGCLEAYAGSYGLLRRVRELKSGRASRLADIMDPRALNLAARRGDKICIKVWKEAGEMLGRAIVNLSYVLNPEYVLLSGGVAQAGSLLLEPARRVMRQNTFAGPLKPVKIRVARRPNLGALGAALAAMDNA